METLETEALADSRGRVCERRTTGQVLVLVQGWMQATRVQCGGQSRYLPADSGAQQPICVRAHNSFTENHIVLVTFFLGLTTTGDAFVRLQYRPRFPPPCRHSQTTSGEPPARLWCAELILRSRHSTNDVPELILSRW